MEDWKFLPRSALLGLPAVLGRALAQVAAAVGPDAIPHLGKGKPWKLNEQFNTIINIS